MSRAEPGLKRRALIIWLVGFGLVLLVVAGAIVWLFVRPPHDSSVNSTSHPDPAITAQAYLDAIAAGDADAARAFDESSFEAYPVQNTGTTLLTNEALGSAVERISEVSVKLQGATEESATVATSFTLAGEKHTQSLFLVWDTVSTTWQVERSFASPISVSADNGEPDGLRYLPFQVGDSAKLQQKADDKTLLGFVAYPAVYDLTVDLDPDRVEDIEANPLEHQVVVIPDQDQFPVITYTLVD